MTEKAGVIGLIVALLALACSAVALGIPYWQDLDTATVTGNHGLFLYMFTSASGDYLDYVSGSDKTSLTAVRGLIISGTSLLVMSTLFGVAFACCSERKCLGVSAAVPAFLSSLSHAAGSLVFRFTLADTGASSLHSGFYLATVAAVLGTFAGGSLLKAANNVGSKIREATPTTTRQELPQRHRSIVGLCSLLLAVFALAGSGVALGIPYWQNIDTGSATGNHGLFRHEIASAGTDTTGDYIDYLEPSDRGYLTAVRVLTILGTSFLLLAVTALFVFNCTKLNRKCAGVFGAVCCMLSAVLLCAGVVLFRVRLQGSGDSSYLAGFYLEIAAAIAASIASALLLFAALRNDAEEINDRDNTANKGRPVRQARHPHIVEISPLLKSDQAMAGGFGLLVGFLAFACSAVSLGIPYWQTLDTGTITGNHGLFRYTVTTSGTETSGDYKQLLSESKHASLYAVRGLVAAGLLSVLVSLVSILAFMCANNRPSCGYLGAACCLLSGIVHITAVVIFRVQMKGEGDSTFHAGFYVAIVAALASCTAGVIVVITTRMWQSTTDEKNTQNQIQADEKMKEPSKPNPANKQSSKKIHSSDQPVETEATHLPLHDDYDDVEYQGSIVISPEVKRYRAKQTSKAKPESVVKNKTVPTKDIQDDYYDYFERQKQLFIPHRKGPTISTELVPNGQMTREHAATYAVDVTDKFESPVKYKPKINHFAPMSVYSVEKERMNRVSPHRPEIVEPMADADRKRAVWQRETNRLELMKY